MSNSSRHRSSSVSLPSSLSKDCRRKSHQPHYASSLSPSRKRDVELWRRDQKLTTRVGPYTHTKMTEPSLIAESPTSAHSVSPFSGPVVAPTLPSTAEAFNLFPQHKRRRRSSTRLQSRFDFTYSTAQNNVNSTHQSSADLDQLRSNAFWELQKTVEEAGEGFVRKMRDWENVRASHGVRRGRKRPQSMAAPRTGSGEEEEVLIFSEDARRDDSHPPRKKRALSVGLMDLETSHTMEFNGTLSSPIDHWASLSSDFTSDDETDSVNVGSDNLGTNTTNPSSSPMSWSFSSDSPSFSLIHSFHENHRNTPSAQAVTHSEKALAALALAMANGAGLNDYQAVLNASSGSSLSNDYQAGELWE